MGLWNGIKNLMNVNEDDYDDDDIEETGEPEKKAPRKEKEREREREQREAPVKRETARTSFDRRSKTVPFSQGSMEVVLVKPEHFEDVTSITDQYCAKKTIILNLERADHDLSRRIIDFFSGVAYARNGTLRKAANNTFVLAPSDVDISGETTGDEYDTGSYSGYNGGY